MFHLVTGGSGSGKSEYAEKLILESGAEEKIYVATMEVFGEEGRRKVERHRKLRDGKGFCTVECPRKLWEIEFGDKGFLCGNGGDILGKKEVKRRAVLVECMSNLAANELFSGDGSVWEITDGAVEREITGDDAIRNIAGDGAAQDIAGNAAGSGKGFGKETFSFAGKQAKERILRGILSLKDRCDFLVVVTNEVFSDGIDYGPETNEYIRLLGEVNGKLAGWADAVTEVVYGIPVEYAAKANDSFSRGSLTAGKRKDRQCVSGSDDSPV